MNNWERKSVAQHCSTSSSAAKYCSVPDVRPPIHELGTKGRATTEGGSEADKAADGGDDVDVCGRGVDGGEDLVELAPELCGRVELVVDALHRVGCLPTGPAAEPRGTTCVQWPPWL